MLIPRGVHTAVLAAGMASSPEVLEGIVTSLLLDKHVRGRDQRGVWVRTLSRIHPVWRLGIVVAACAVACAFSLRPWSSSQCATVGIRVLHTCTAALQLCGVAAVSLAVGALAATHVSRGKVEEIKDHAITDDELAAAASAAVYEATPASRLKELRSRGVESRNWEVDVDLSTDNFAVFVNCHAQRVVLAFRGTVTMQDWASNMKSVLPGHEDHSASFQLALARYNCPSLLLPSVASCCLHLLFTHTTRCAGRGRRNSGTFSFVTFFSPATPVAAPWRTSPAANLACHQYS